VQKEHQPNANDEKSINQKRASTKCKKSINQMQKEHQRKKSINQMQMKMMEHER